MKLYYSPGACSLSPHIVLHETGLKHELVKTNLADKTYEGGGDFRAKNPNGYVPTLELDDGRILTEGPAIIQYLADKAPEKKLAPANGTFERAQMQGWLNFISTELHKTFSPLFNAKMPEEAKEIFRDRLKQRFETMDRHLAKNQFLCGDSFSLPDAYAFTVLNWTKRLKIDLSPFKNLSAYHARVGERPAVKAAMKMEGLSQ
jgi:glutathione S-transferase